MTGMEFCGSVGEWISALPSAGRSSATVRTYKRAVDLFSEFLNRSDRAGNEINPGTVAAFRADLAAAGLSPSSVRLYLSILAAFFSDVCRDGIADKNPAAEAEKPPRTPVRLDLLRGDEIRTLMGRKEPPAGLTRRTFPRDRAIISLLISAGLRSAELRGLRLCDLHADTGTITIERGKGGKPREIAFPLVAREAVDEYLQSGIRPAFAGETGFLFGTDADEKGKSTNGKTWKPFSSPGLLGLVKRYVRAAVGHDGIGVHDLRHAYASMAAEMGVPITYISRSMGHSSTAITQTVYIDILDQSHAAQMVGAAFDQLYR